MPNPDPHEYDPAAFVADEFATYVNRRWYEAYVDTGLTMENAASFWDLVRPGEVDIEMCGGPVPMTQVEVDEARVHYDGLCREALRDRRVEEYDVREYPGRGDRRWEIEPECEDE